MSAVRILLVAAAVGGSVVMVFAWILERYLADFLPLLIIAAAVGFVDVWRRLEWRPRRARVLVLALLSVLGLFSIAANFGIALSPTETWSTGQARNFVATEKSISDVTGHPLAAQVARGEKRPFSWAPRGQLFVLGDCSALYISDGLGLKGDPTYGVNWLLVEESPNRSLCRSLEADG